MLLEFEYTPYQKSGEYFEPLSKSPLSIKIKDVVDILFLNDVENYMSLIN